MANTGNTQQIIDYGASANDGQGDPLRTAFIKTDENFTNIWLAGPVGSNITITNNTIGVQNTNGNLTLAPNGVGVIQSRNAIIPWIDSVYDLGGPNNYWRDAYISSMSVTDANISGDMLIGGNLIINGNIIEVGSITTDSKIIHLANTAVTKGQANVSGITVGANSNIASFLWIDETGWTSNNMLTVKDQMFQVTNSTGSGNTWSIGLDILSTPTGATWVSRRDDSTDYIQSSPGGYIDISALKPGNVFGESTSLHIDQSYFSFTLYDGVDRSWIFDLAGNTYFPSYNFPADDGNPGDALITNGLGNIYWATVTNYANANAVAYGESGWAGNIIPAASNTYSLGNSTNQWLDLYVSNTTIYINNVPISLTSSNILTVDGNPVVVNTPGNVANIGNFVFNNNALENLNGSSFDNGDLAHGWTARLSLPANGGLNPALFQNIYGNISIGVGNASLITSTWLFDTDGVFSAAGDIITSGNVSADSFLGDGSQLTGIIGNAAYATNAGTAWSVEAGNVSGLATVATSGEYADLANVPTNLNQFTNGPGYITTATANVISVNGKTGTVTVAEYSNAAVADYLNSGSFTGDISTTGNITGGNLYTAGTLTSGPQNITGNVNVTGNITVTQGNLYYDQVYDLVVGDPLIYLGANNTGNVYDLGIVVSYDDGTYQHGGWVRDASDGTWKLFGNVVAEPTTVVDFANAIYQPMQAGAITATSGYYSQTLSTAGNIIGANILAAGYFSASGNVTGTYVLGNGSQLTGFATVAFTGDYANLTGTPTNLNQFTNGPGYITTATANVVSVNGQGGVVTVVEYSNSAVATYLASGTDTQNITTSGNISGAYLFGNISQATGGYGNANVVANLSSLSSNPVSTTGNITGGNLLTGGLISATGVIRTADGMTATANITGGNLLTSGIVSATSDVFAGSGQFRTTASTANIVNSTPTTVNIAGGANIAVNIGNASGVVSLSGNVQGSTNGFAIGYRDIPQVSMNANATINLTDAGKHYYSTSASNLVLTIANNASQAFAIGTAINIINRGTGTMTITRGGGVSLYLAGNTTSSDRTLSSYGAATIQKIETDAWFIVGVGLT